MVDDPADRRTTPAGVVRALTWLALLACAALASVHLVGVALDDDLDPALTRLLLSDVALGVVAGLPAPATTLFAAERRRGRLTGVDTPRSGRAFRASLGRVLVGVLVQVLVGVVLLGVVDDPGGWALVALVGVPLAATAAAVLGLAGTLLVLKPVELLLRLVAGRLGLGPRVSGPTAVMAGVVLAVVPVASLLAVMTGKGRRGGLAAVLMLLGLAEPVDATAAWALRALVVAGAVTLAVLALRRRRRRAGGVGARS